MPHSSGGGSRSGGSHSSSHSSSYSRSYSSSSSDSKPSARVSKSPFPGASKYVYYRRRRKKRARPIYYYADSQNTDFTLGILILSLVLWSVLAGCIIWTIYLFVFFTPKPLDLNSYTSEIVIEDHLELIDEEKVMPALETFRKTTGVTPGIEVVENQEWKQYDSLEEYSYNEYLSLYKDEKHWLVVLSYPENYNDDVFVEWSWEGMIGDQCYTSINSNLEDTFTEIVQENLSNSSPESVSEDLANAYYSFLEVWPETQISYVSIGLMILVIILYIICVIIYVRYYQEQNQIKKAIYVPNGSKEIECEYCGSIYLTKTVKECPNCGAKHGKKKS